MIVTHKIPLAQHTSLPAASASVALLSGVGPRTLENLKQLGIHSIQDLLFHLPLRYQDRTRLMSIRQLQVGQAALIEGEVIQSQVIRSRRSTLLCRFSDGSGIIQFRFFHFNAQQLQRFKREGLKLRCFGEVRLTRGGLEMVHPECYEVKPGEALPLSSGLTPFYPTTQGLQQTSLRKLIKQALEWMVQHKISVEELLPSALLNELKFPPLQAAVAYLHAPSPEADQAQLLEGRHPMQQRLAFEELLAHHLALLQVRANIQDHAATPLPAATPLQQKLAKALGFKLTSAQERVIAEIHSDLAKPYPMLRLVQGDVGSGKTVVAACALLQAVSAGFQAAMMAPTELLAEQHYQTLKSWFEPLGVSVALLSSSLPRAQRTVVLKSLALGSLSVVVGTHALIQSEIEFAQLKLLIIDEQHRFGVHHRLALKEKGEQGAEYPHQLIMTATPIPRTLAMSAYADLDSSIIDELPPGRQAISTCLVANARRLEVIERVRVHCQHGNQAYWVCTLIEESELLQCEAAECTAKALREALPELSVGLMHGRLKPEEKERLMAAFKAGEIQLLVATTIVEVGVDVPKASLMIIENPERLGLAQLHQLRGRVGRGSLKSYCILLFQAPLSESARKRLSIMRASQNGFIIAQQDLEMRGPGEVLGTRQAGLMQLKVADLMRDKKLLPKIVQISSKLKEHYPTQIPKIIQRWLAAKAQYAQV